MTEATLPPTTRAARRGRLVVEAVCLAVAVVVLVHSFNGLRGPWPLPATVVIVVSLVVLSVTQRRIAGSAPTDTVVVEAGVVFLVPACVLLPVGAAMLLSAATDVWFNFQFPETRGRRRFDMTLQMAPAYGIASWAAHWSLDAGVAFGTAAAVAAVTYGLANAAAVFSFGRFFWLRSVKSVYGDGSVWAIDACLAGFGLLTAVAAHDTAWAALAAVPVCLLCQYAFLRPHLEAQLNGDPKTSLLNARGMNEAGESLAAAAARDRTPLAALMIDIDHFKKINDEYGHPAGDQVIREVASRVRTAIRADSPVGRIGGEEYLVLLPGATLAAAISAGERVREAVAAQPITTHRGLVAATVSVGCAVSAGSVGGESPSRSYAVLLSDADVELYAAKSAGRNTVRPIGAGPKEDRRRTPTGPYPEPAR